MLFSTCRKHMRRLLISACSSLSHRRRELPMVEAGWFCRLDTHKQILFWQEVNSLMRASTTSRSKSRQLRVGWCSLNCITIEQESQGYIKALRVFMTWSPRRCGIMVAKWWTTKCFFSQLRRSVLKKKTKIVEQQLYQGKRLETNQARSSPAARLHRETGWPWLNGKLDTTASNRCLREHVKGIILVRWKRK